MTSARRVLSRPGLAVPDPFRPLWSLLTNVKFALLLVGSAAAAGLLAVVIPQMPGPMRANPAGRSAWLELQRQTFGPLTTPMERWGFFEVYHTWWFNGLWVLIIFAVTVCTVSRFPPIWRSIHRPPLRVPEAYFERARFRATVEAAVPPERVAAALRRRRFAVREAPRTGAAIELFADRFAWAQYGTFLSHLALLLLLVGGLLTKFAGFERVLALAETGAAAPIFDEPGPGQIFIELRDAIRRTDSQGNVTDFRSFITVRRGDETVACTVTVNGPCQAFGYRFHQAAFIDDLARLRITGPDGRPLYDDVFDFNGDVLFVPRLQVWYQGHLVLDRAIPQMATDPGPTDDRADDFALASFAVPGGEGDAAGLTVAWRRTGGDLFVVAGDAADEAHPLPPGRPVAFASGLEVLLAGQVAIPYRQVADLPGTVDALATVQMPRDAAGRPYLYLVGVDEHPLALLPGESKTTAAGYTYTFVGPVEGAGIDVRRDPGDTFIWVAVGLALVGLGLTFYVPRRRLWVRITDGRVVFAGLADRMSRFDRELAQLTEELRQAATPPVRHHQGRA